MAGDRQVASALPPGCRFRPTDDQLFAVYLLTKNANPSGSDPCNAIGELDFLSHSPDDLPDTACFPYGCGGRKRHWYFYTLHLATSRSRRAKGGFWRMRGRARDVTVGGAGKVILGTKTCFAFYSGNSCNTAVRTDWIMFEYALVDHLEAPFVLCRVFVKGKRGNNLSDKHKRPCANGSGLQVPYVHEELGINGSIDCMNNISRGPTTLTSEFKDQVTPGLASVTDSQFHVDSQPSEMLRYPLPLDSGPANINIMSEEQLISILEDGFIELDDLISP